MEPDHNPESAVDNSQLDKVEPYEISDEVLKELEALLMANDSESAPEGSSMADKLSIEQPAPTDTGVDPESCADIEALIAALEPLTESSPAHAHDPAPPVELPRVTPVPAPPGGRAAPPGSEECALIDIIREMLAVTGVGGLWVAPVQHARLNVVERGDRVPPTTYEDVSGVIINDWYYLLLINKKWHALKVANGEVILRLGIAHRSFRPVISRVLTALIYDRIRIGEPRFKPQLEVLRATSAAAIVSVPEPPQFPPAKQPSAPPQTKPAVKQPKQPKAQPVVKQPQIQHIGNRQQSSPAAESTVAAVAVVHKQQYKSPLGGRVKRY
jgi:hypothetical protein